LFILTFKVPLFLLLLVFDEYGLFLDDLNFGFLIIFYLSIVFYLV